MVNTTNVEKVDVALNFEGSSFLTALDHGSITQSHQFVLEMMSH